MRKLLLCFYLVVLVLIPLDAIEPEKNENQEFTFDIKLAVTAVKDQNKSSTCWSFATISFIESELLRMYNKTYDLSEMYIVRKAYKSKAEKYIRMHGAINFAGGGEANDVIDVIRSNGIMPDNVYSGLINDSLSHYHEEMDLNLKMYIEEVTSSQNNIVADNWEHGFTSILDSYLGNVPKVFDYQGKEFDAISFAASLNFNPNDYVLISSFNHHPFYSAFILEVPDNWSWGEVYNIPLQELVEVTNFALSGGYSLVWAADYSEKGFMHKQGMAVAPRIDYFPANKQEEKLIKKMSPIEYKSMFSSLETPIEELKVNQDIRQAAFDNYSTTDDHGMHIVGKASDLNGKNYYYVKNSWGTDNKYGGYLFVSEAYFKYKTISILLHKDAIPENIRVKLGF